MRRTHAITILAATFCLLGSTLAQPVDADGVDSAPRLTQAVDKETVIIAAGDLFTDDLSSDDVIDAVEAALSLHEDDESVTARFHEPTGLILGRGSADQMQTVREVIEQLRVVRSRTAKQDQTQQLQHEITILRDELTSRRALTDVLHQENVQLETRAQMLGRQADEFAARQRDRENLILQLRGELQVAQETIRALQSQIVDLEARGKRDNGTNGGRTR